jgi:hypothetical protein
MSTEVRFTVTLDVDKPERLARHPMAATLRAAIQNQFKAIEATAWAKSLVTVNSFMVTPDTTQPVIDNLVDALGLLGFADPHEEVNGGDCVDVICEHWDQLAPLASVWPLTEDQRELCTRVKIGTRVRSINGEISDTDDGEKSTAEGEIGTITAIDLTQQNGICLAFELSEVSVLLSVAELADEDKYEIDPDEPVYTTREDVIRAVEGLLGHEGSYELATRVYEYMREQGMVEHNGQGFVIERDTNVFQIAADLSRADLPDSYPPELAIADHHLTADQLFTKYSTKRDNGEHPQHLRRDWRHDVAEDNTILGYWQWVEHQIELARD